MSRLFLEVPEYLQYNASLIYVYSDHLEFKLAANNFGESKNSDPEGSSESDRFGFEGLSQPDESVELSMNYSF